MGKDVADVACFEQEVRNKRRKIRSRSAYKGGIAGTPTLTKPPKPSGRMAVRSACRFKVKDNCPFAQVKK